MTKIGSDPFKIPFNSKLYADSESEIRLSIKPKQIQKIPKTKKHDFCSVYSDRNFVPNQKKFMNSALSNYPKK